MKKIFIETPFLDETSFNGYLLSHLSYRDFLKKTGKYRISLRMDIQDHRYFRVLEILN